MKRPCIESKRMAQDLQLPLHLHMLAPNISKGMRMPRSKFCKMIEWDISSQSVLLDVLDALIQSPPAKIRNIAQDTGLFEIYESEQCAKLSGTRYRCHWKGLDTQFEDTWEDYTKVAETLAFAVFLKRVIASWTDGSSFNISHRRLPRYNGPTTTLCNRIDNASEMRDFIKQSIEVRC